MKLNRAATLLFCLFSTAVLARTMEVKKADDFDPAAYKKVAFLPFTMAPGAEDKERVECPLAGVGRFTCGMEDKAASELSKLLARALDAAPLDIDRIGQEEINAARARLKEEGRPELDQYGSWQTAIGRELEADAVLFGFVYCYRERSGGAYASAAPAAIGFCLHLVDPDTGKTLWSFYYEDEQKPLSQNLLDIRAFLKRGGKWITVAEMAEEAVQAAVAAMPYQTKKD